MIGFNYLGHMGRLGNQMFQFAALLGTAKRKKYDICIPLSSSQQLSKGFELSSVKKFGFVDGDTIKEESFSFDPKIALNCPDNVTLMGYFQSEKYFINAEKEVRENFKFRERYLKPCLETRKLISKGKVISLHIRRTDYLTDPNHKALELDYYEQALAKMPKSYPVLIFTDDVAWAKAQDLFSSDRFLVSEEGDAYIDLCLQTLCDYHIIANSSYSWWGAWLATSKKVIAPKHERWFGALDHSTDDLIPSNWIRL